MICGIKAKEVLQNIDKNEIFKTVCQIASPSLYDGEAIKNIDYDTIISNLINKIQESNLCDKDDYIEHREVWDSEYIHIIKEKDILFVDDDLLWTKKQALKFYENDLNNDYELDELWIETNNKEKEVIQIAQECGVKEISVEMM